MAVTELEAVAFVELGLGVAEFAADDLPAVLDAVAALGIGTLTDFWHLGHLPFFPANESGTDKTWPQLHLNLIGMLCRVLIRFCNKPSCASWNQQR